MSKLKVTTISDPDNDNTAITVDTSGNVTFAQNATFSGTVTGISSYADSDALDLFNVTGSAPVYACRAWVNFNGTGTVAIRTSGNVSSITDNGTGNYTVNFTTAMPDTDYTGVCSGDRSDTGIVNAACGHTSTTSRTTNAYQILNANTANGTALDGANINIAVFR